MVQNKIGPGELSKSNAAPKENPFILSSAEWLSIQVYVNDALSLPTTPEAFQKSLGSDAPKVNPADFKSLIDCYEQINTHCAEWKKTIFPASVNLASDVVAYALKVPTYYGAITPIAQKLTANPKDVQAKKELKAIIDNLAAQATTYQGNAQHVADMITTFAANTAADKVTLLGKDGMGGVAKEYMDKYGTTSDEVKSLITQLNDLNKQLEADTKEYNHDVVVAATSATYGWIWPFGTIAAGIVAGVYGKKATAAMDRIHAEQAKIKTISPVLEADANLVADLTRANKGITQIAADITNALPVIQKIEGVWGSIASDLTNIGKIIQNDIERALPIIMSLGVDEAIAAWQKLSNEADGYRVNAYIDVKTPEAL